MSQQRTHNREHLEQNPIVKRWLDDTSRNPGTRKNYVISLFYYLIYTDRSPEQLIRDQRAFSQQDPLSKDYDPTKGAKVRLETFREWLLEDHLEHIITSKRRMGGNHKDKTVQQPFKALSPGTVNRTVAAVRSFYGFYQLSIPKLKRGFKLRRLRETTTHEEIRRALKQADKRERALILVTATTGLSPVDLLKLKVKDIKREEKYRDYGFILGEYRQKTRVPIVAWVTPEALTALDEYLELRNAQDDEPLFTDKFNEQTRPLKQDSANKSLTRLAERVFTERLTEDEKLERNPINFRALRGWFGVQCGRALKPEHKDILMSHAQKYNGAYSQHLLLNLFESAKKLYEKGYTRIEITPEQHQLDTLETRLQKEIQIQTAEAVENALKLYKQDRESDSEDFERIKLLIEADAEDILEDLDELNGDRVTKSYIKGRVESILEIIKQGPMETPLEERKLFLQSLATLPESLRPIITQFEKRLEENPEAKQKWKQIEENAEKAQEEVFRQVDPELFDELQKAMDKEYSQMTRKAKKKRSVYAPVSENGQELEYDDQSKPTKKRRSKK